MRIARKMGYTIFCLIYPYLTIGIIASGIMAISFTLGYLEFVDSFAPQEARDLVITDLAIKQGSFQSRRGTKFGPNLGLYDILDGKPYFCPATVCRFRDYHHFYGRPARVWISRGGIVMQLEVDGLIRIPFESFQQEVSSEKRAAMAWCALCISLVILKLFLRKQKARV